MLSYTLSSVTNRTYNTKEYRQTMAISAFFVSLVTFEKLDFDICFVLSLMFQKQMTYASLVSSLSYRFISFSFSFSLSLSLPLIIVIFIRSKCSQNFSSAKMMKMAWMIKWTKAARSTECREHKKQSPHRFFSFLY